MGYCCIKITGGNWESSGTLPYTKSDVAYVGTTVTWAGAYGTPRVTVTLWYAGNTRNILNVVAASGEYVIPQSEIDAFYATFHQYPNLITCYFAELPINWPFNATTPLPFSTISINLEDANTLDPIVGAPVTINGVVYTSDENGRATSAYLANGSSYNYSATAAGYYDSGTLTSDVLTANWSADLMMQYIEPSAAFSGTPLSGARPLTVAFTDASTQSPTSWYWQFGDGTSSNLQNPSHIYNSYGSFTVSLIAYNHGGSDGETKIGYVNVSYTPQSGGGESGPGSIGSKVEIFPTAGKPLAVPIVSVSAGQTVLISKNNSAFSIVHGEVGDRILLCQTSGKPIGIYSKGIVPPE
jgi:PKD repeat protein